MIALNRPDLSPRARRTLPALLAVTTLACGTSRYVGSVGRDGTYANRGYGLAWFLGDRGLADRWKVLDPAALPQRPRPGMPVASRDPIDINGDGMLSVGESVLHFDPTVRLLSKTATAARADLRVEILSGPAERVNIDRLLARALKIWTRTPKTVRLRAYRGADRSPIRGLEARVSTATTAEWHHHVAVVDQGRIRAEANVQRRQLVTLHVYSPTPAPADLERDFRDLLEVLILSRKAAPETARERW